MGDSRCVGVDVGMEVALRRLEKAGRNVVAVFADEERKRTKKAWSKADRERKRVEKQRRKEEKQRRKEEVRWREERVKSTIVTLEGKVATNQEMYVEREWNEWIRGEERLCTCVGTVPGRGCDEEVKDVDRFGEGQGLCDVCLLWPVIVDVAGLQEQGLVDRDSCEVLEGGNYSHG